MNIAHRAADLSIRTIQTMDDDKFYEIRERLIELLNIFEVECKRLGIDYSEEVDLIVSEIESS